MLLIATAAHPVLGVVGDLHDADPQGLEQPQIVDAIFNAGQDLASDGSQFDHLFEDGDQFSVGALSARAIHTPGHTPGSICLVFGGVVLTGDTLFPGGPGRTRSNEALQQEIASIRTHLLPMQPGDVPATAADTSALETWIGFKPNTPVQEGVGRFVAWYREFYGV